MISIITINFNNKIGLAETMESVLRQDKEYVEYIVIDGGSSDGSAEAIRTREKELAYWVSERDNGIYHAMNKGIARARGEYLLFLNSGDTFNGPNSLSRLLADNPTEDIIY